MTCHRMAPSLVKALEWENPSEGDCAVIRIAIAFLALAHGGNGLLMIFAPALWFTSTPGVEATGPYNPHLVADVGFAFLASGVLFGLALARPAWRAPLLIAAALWPALHGLLHAFEWVSHGPPTEAVNLITETLGIYGIAALGVVLAYIEAKAAHFGSKP